MSVETLARKTGYTAEFVEKVERGERRKLTGDDVQAFADALGVDVTDLVKYHGSEDV